MTRRPVPAVDKPRSGAGDGIIRSYLVSSWLVLRLYGAVLGVAAVLIWSGEWPATGLLATVAPLISPNGVVITFGALAVMLLVPPFTPSVLRLPASVVGGLTKAVLLMILSGLVYGVMHFMLEDQFLRHSSALKEVLPLFIKAVAGMAVTGSILVSLSMSLNADKALGDATGPKMSDSDLRALRRARMNSGA